MSALSQPRDPLIEQALTDAGFWCHGHVIDDRPALAHAVRVARKLDEHAPGRPSLICAALLHDSPLFAPDSIDLDAYLTGRYGSEVTRVVRAMQAQHEALDSANPPLLVDDLPVLLTSTADKIVALTSLLHRARLSGDVKGFFDVRQPLLRLQSYFRQYQQAGAALVPPGMATDLARALDQIDQATSGCVRQP